MAKKKQKARRKPGNQGKPRKGILLYHDMAVYENFERCTQRVFKIVKGAQENYPNAPRRLVLDVQGHRSDEGGYDRDAWEVIRYFVLELLFPYLTSVSTPLAHIENRKRQRNDLPAVLDIAYPGDDDSFWYDVDQLPVRPREIISDVRKSAPSKGAIADYLGMSADPACLVCWHRPAERAHVVPLSLGGSMDVRNFALLCEEHHREAPDIADAEGFWAWVDYAEMRDRGSKWEDASEDVQAMASSLGARIGRADRSEADFMEAVKFELIHLYGWGDVDFSGFSWELYEEYHRVLDAATGKHFGVEKKVSTHAWALDVALYRVNRDAKTRSRRRRRVLLFDTLDANKQPVVLQKHGIAGGRGRHEVETRPEEDPPPQTRS
ncbi:HNH endonuclease [Amycolatopsis nivea]